MLNFFQPTSKVQKDRRIMRETDSRMAKYSRRGLVFNFLAFVICLVGGRFFDENKDLTIVLSTGLLLVTLLRGFFLFRFDQLYPRAPTKWRNSYFVATLLGAIWWGTILVSLILVVGLRDETPLLLLYTIVFFSTTAHAFAPYQGFLSYYQFFGIIPAAGAALLVSGLEGTIYGLLLLIYYLILTHQCRLISENYWEKLAATYALSQKAFFAEEEKRDRKAILQLTKEFLAHLDHRLWSNKGLTHSVNSTISDEQVKRQLFSVIQSVHDFKDIVFKDIVIAKKIFNIRHELQYLVSEVVEQAEERQIQIETALSPTLPMRLKGDAERFAQIIKTLLSLFVETTRDCALLIEVQFLREYEAAGELYVTIREVKHSKQGFFGGSKSTVRKQSLSLIVAKGLADAMSGSIENVERPKDDDEFRFNAKLDLADSAGQLDFHRGRFNGDSILLLHSNPSIVDIKRQELDSLGFVVTTETQHKRAKTLLTQGIKQGNPIENIIFYYENDNPLFDSFVEDLLEADELRYINKIIAATPKQQVKLLGRGIGHGRGFFFVDKPVGLFELESTFDYIFNREESVEGLDIKPVIIYSQGAKLDEKVEEEIAGINWPSITLDSLSQFPVHISKVCAIVIPCQSGDSMSSIVEKIRELEPYSQEGDYEFLPIVGIGNDCSQEGVCVFEVGVDDYINLATNTNKTLDSSLRYWNSLRNIKH